MSFDQVQTTEAAPTKDQIKAMKRILLISQGREPINAKIVRRAITLLDNAKASIRSAATVIGMLLAAYRRYPNMKDIMDQTQTTIPASYTMPWRYQWTLSYDDEPDFFYLYALRTDIQAWLHAHAASAEVVMLSNVEGRQSPYRFEHFRPLRWSAERGVISEVRFANWSQMVRFRLVFDTRNLLALMVSGKTS